MMPVRRPPESMLAAGTRAAMARRGATAARLPAGDKKISQRWDGFRDYGRGRYRDDVHGVLGPASAGKCVYCERRLRSPTIDHFWPKSRYPERLLTWENWLLACKDCNSSKSATFELDEGQPRLINPHDDDPATLYRWDLGSEASTGQAVALNSGATRRVEASVQAYGLDDEALKVARADHWLDTLYLLSRVVDGDAEARSRLIPRLDVSGAYRSVIRQMHRMVEALFDAAVAVAPELAPLVATLGQPLQHPDHPTE